MNTWIETKWKEENEKFDEFGDVILERKALFLPLDCQNSKYAEYIICLENGDHYIATFEGNQDAGWFYVEDMPALYPVAWKKLEKYMKSPI